MKNLDLVFMLNSGILDITNHELPASSAYKVVKFRSAVNKTFKKIQGLEEDILKDVGIEDPQVLNKRLKELNAIKNRTEEQEAELNELCTKRDRYNKLREDMLQEKLTLENVETISYEDWHTLRKENKPKKDGGQDPLNNYVENLLEDILWAAPEN